ncbi:MAG: DUF1223 domain-containing protein [Alphaproteobacteria bacterium]|nr:DUF1223 domain-containing protein [Alphaproteobacteria bacterium]
MLLLLRGSLLAGIRAALAATVVAVLLPAQAQAREPVVVELFTSQGCSSCPPANDYLAVLSERPNVIALSFGVTYWDDLGWKDTFASPQFTRRQRDYAPRLGNDSVYTPQMVVNGHIDVVGSKRRAVDAAIEAAGRDPAGPSLTVGDSRIAVGAGAAPEGGADLWLVRYDPRVVQVPVRRGENGGRTLPHKNVVHDLTRLARWTGQPLTVGLSPPGDGMAWAVLLQGAHGGPILAAARGD